MFELKGMFEKTKKLKKPSWWHHPLIGYPLIIFVVCFGLFILYWIGSFFLGIIQVMTGTYF